MTSTDGNITGREERDALAGEYVLGTLDASERQAAQARIAADPEFRASVARWQERLQPLTDVATPVTVPPELWDRIASRLGDNAAPDATNVVALRRSVMRWRISTVAFAAAAAALVAFVVVERNQPPSQSEFVAVLTAPDGTTPAFVATVDVANRSLQIIRVATPPPPDKSYELWSILPDQAPRSLGVVEKASLRSVIGEKPSPDVTLAITLEQRGGSPTGAPQGPLVFSGTLLPAR